MARDLNINWPNLMGALRRLPDSELSELLEASKAKLDELGIDTTLHGKPSVRMGDRQQEEGQCYNHRSVLDWIACCNAGASGKSRMPRSVDETTSQDAINRHHLANLYATLVARGVKAKAK